MMTKDIGGSEPPWGLALALKVAAPTLVYGAAILALLFGMPS